MDIQKKIVSLLVEFGFSQKNAELYLQILSSGEVKQEHILENAEFVEGVDKLLSLKLIAVDMVKDNYILYAIPPRLAWGAITNETIWRFHDRFEDFSKIREYDALPEGYGDIVEHACNLFGEIAKLSEKVYSGTTSVSKHYWREALNNDHLSILLSEAVSESRNSIYSISKPPRSKQLSIIWESLIESIKRGVTYKRIVPLSEVVEHGLFIVQRDIEQYGVDLRVLDVDVIEHKFYIVDNKYLMVYHITGHDHSNVFGRVTSKREIIKRYKKNFFRYYEQSIPAMYVVDILRDVSKQKLKRAKYLNYQKKELDWLECLINWGGFCNVSSNEVPNLDKLIERALDDKLVILGTNGRLTLNYETTFFDIISKWERHKDAK